MEQNSAQEIIQQIELTEKRAKKRALIFTFVPLFFTTILLIYISIHVTNAQKELKTIRAQADALSNQKNLLAKQNDSLTGKLSRNFTLFGEALSIIVEYKKLVDGIKPPNRTSAEAAFYINLRMSEDKVRGNYNDLCKELSQLPELDKSGNWLVIVQTSASLDDLKTDPHVKELIEIYGKNQVAIYAKPNKSYVLCVNGNGTFTRAYRLNVELSYHYGYIGSYFSELNTPGFNYLDK